MTFEQARLAAEWAAFAKYSVPLFDQTELMPDDDQFLAFGMAMTKLAFLDTCNWDMDDRLWYRAYFAMAGLPGFEKGSSSVSYYGMETSEAQFWKRIFWTEKAWPAAQLVNAGVFERDAFDQFVEHWLPNPMDEQAFWKVPVLPNDDDRMGKL